MHITGLLARNCQLNSGRELPLESGRDSLLTLLCTSSMMAPPSILDAEHKVHINEAQRQAHDHCHKDVHQMKVILTPEHVRYFFNVPDEYNVSSFLFLIRMCHYCKATAALKKSELRCILNCFIYW